MSRCVEFAFALALCAAAAQAQTLKVTSTQTATSFVTSQDGGYAPDSIFSQSGPVQNGATQFTDGAGGGTTASYANYQNVVNQTASDIQFANNATARGYAAETTSTSTITISVTNTGATAVSPTLNSQILPGGFGFYMDNPVANPTFSNGVAGNINEAPQSLTAAFSNGQSPYGGGYPLETTSTTGQSLTFTTPPGTDIGEVSFDFDILSNGVSVADYNGVLQLTPTGSTLTLNPAAQTLTNFRAIAASLPQSFVGYGWDATDVPTIQLGSLAPNATDTISYVTKVTSTVDDFDDYDTFGAPGATGNYTTSPGLIGYSGFGDPISKASGAKGVADPNFALLNLGLITYQNGSISGGDLESYSPSLPVTDVDVTPSDDVPPSYSPSVPPPAPEPDAWALMLSGFALAGGALRRASARRRAEA